MTISFVGSACPGAREAMVSLAVCPACRKEFKGSTVKSAKSARDRHVRESHKGALRSAAASQQRRSRDAAAKQRCRLGLERSAPRSSATSAVAALVLRPLRRDCAAGLFTEAPGSWSQRASLTCPYLVC